MRKNLLIIASILLCTGAFADEGMWIPMLIGKNYDQMLRLGLKLTPADLYSINHSSMKDAIVQFAGGCTAEMISENGLVLTNHHCGYDAIASLSTVDRDLLDNGFWAHNYMEELPAQGVTVLFLQQMTDVTDTVKSVLGDATGEEYNKKLEALTKAMEKEASDNGKLVASLKSYFNGNQFFLLIYKRYTDVRLVGAPPKSLGKFGGETDNWMWPRHTCDFSMFRVYAGKDNEPAVYSPDNVPYKPKHFLPVSIKGEQEGDYAMIFGYPGRTDRYAVSYSVDMSINTVNPAIVACRDLRLNIMHKHMVADKSVYLTLTSRYASVANYWKYFIGQTEQLKRLNVVDEKRRQESEFSTWETENNISTGLLGKFASLYSGYAPYAKAAVFNTECFRAPVVSRLASVMEPLYLAYVRNATPNKKKGKEALYNLNTDTLKKYISMAKKAYHTTIREFDSSTDAEMFAEMTRFYRVNMPYDELPDIYTGVILKDSLNATNKNKKHKKIAKKEKGYHGMSYTAYAGFVFSHTFLTDSVKFNDFCRNPSFDKLKNDAAVAYANSFNDNFKKRYQQRLESFSYQKGDLTRQYLGELMMKNRNKEMYPDANSTMRISYGRVKSYNPQDAVHYRYYTTLDGLMAKYKPGDEEFDVPRELIDLYKAKDYGQYADADGTLHTDFITSNDITGGNSGSPVINGDGELIGAAFDGNWEAMSGDIAFDKKYKRTIVCDIRYILFVVDKLGHADNLIKEMDIRQ